jgi:hypothetical protein
MDRKGCKGLAYRAHAGDRVDGQVAARLAAGDGPARLDAHDAAVTADAVAGGARRADGLLVLAQRQPQHEGTVVGRQLGGEADVVAADVAPRGVVVAIRAPARVALDRWDCGHIEAERAGKLVTTVAS